MATTLPDVLDVQHRLDALRGSAFRGTPRHEAAAGRLRRQTAALLADDPQGPHARSLGCVLEMIGWIEPASASRRLRRRAAG